MKTQGVLQLMNTHCKRALQLIIALLMLVQNAVAQEYNSKFEPYLEQISSALVADLQEFENLGIKVSGSQALLNSRKWLTSKYSEYGYTNIFLDSFQYNGNTNENIIVEKRSNNGNASYILIIGHYDTKNGPGVNDNGSGTATMLSIARIIEPLTSDYHVRFIHFAGEEDGLFGSKHYVENTLNPADEIMVVLNLDQLGGTLPSDEEDFMIYCERDEDNNPSENNVLSNLYTYHMADIIELYTDVKTQISKAYGSDYIPFEEKGYTITGLYQFGKDPFNHSILDSLKNMDTLAFHEIAKGALAYVLELMKSKETVGVKKVQYISGGLYPNPSSGKIEIKHSRQPQEYNVINSQGELVERGITLASELDFSALPNGIYLIQMIPENSKTIFLHKLLILH